MTTGLTAPQLVWYAAGTPAPRWPLEPAAGLCATCGAEVTAGVSHELINSETFSQQGDFFQYGSHVCAACAWFYSDAKQRHRSLIAAGSWLAWPLISHEAAAADPERPSWLAALQHLAGLPPTTPTTGVLTTDPKPRLWPRMRLGTAATPAIYVHALDYDVSRVVRVDLVQLLAVITPITEALNRGFSKRTVWRGLLTDYRRCLAIGRAALDLERTLAPWRPRPEFVPALLIAGRTEETHERSHPGPADRQSQSARAARRRAPETGARQLQLD
ncbi:MAG: hypothetical protein KatS3mg060_1132 [Dehalococcoidia bacterium]|nr:MAG: hypothetical protein KatS3mg060_1132 [Dehalococcoidia bacterium]